MITDNDLYRLAIFLGLVSMVLIVVYHFIEVNTKSITSSEKQRLAQGPSTRAQEKGA